MVPKTGNPKELRLVIDYRQLNKRTIKDKYPLPDIQLMFDAMHGDILIAVDLPDGVRDTPTVATPPLQPPGPAAAGDTPETIAARDAFVEQTRIVQELFANGGHRSVAKSVREEVLGDKDARFKGDDDDAFLLGDLLEALRVEFETAGLSLGVFDIADPTLEDEHSALRYPAGVDPRPILAKEARLVRENKARDWRPDEETRKASLLQRLDFDFYKSIRDKYVLPRNLAQAAPGEVHSSALVSGAAGGAEGAANAEMIRRIFQKLDFVEAFIKMEIKKKGGAASPAAVVADAKRKRGGLKGFRAGHTAQPAVGFDVTTKRAKPLCPRCPSGVHHGWFQCPLGGLKPENAGTEAAYCAPAELSPEEQRSRSLCYVFQQAAEEGAAAFAGAAERHGAPAVLHGDRWPAGGIDLSAYGFAVDQPGASDDSDDSDDEALGEIGELKRQVEDMAARRGVSFTHASFTPQPETVPPAAALPQPAAAAPATSAVRWRDRAQAHSQLAVSLPHAGAPDHVVPEPQGPWMRGPDGLAYSHVAPEPTSVGMHRLGVTPGDASEDENYDSDEADKEFDDKLAASGGFQPGGAYPPAGFHTWGMPLEWTRERFGAGGATHYPNPPLDASPPPRLDALADLLTMALEPDILAAYQRGFLAALQLRDSTEAVPGAGGTAAEGAQRTVVPPPGGEIYELIVYTQLKENDFIQVK
ncbi:hypothetical protein CYMTET_29690 [Cymbomonas tetramitiformis]|uniref:Uncharacterized protein n=1 Tax=Cymbomonas tetramitiformis TaxID=36881 RepID=A0AAE0FKJ3_9CHLO|nr:hypothetical protein CYMTET_29690 [Cymbomonas tetramitiformis]